MIKKKHKCIIFEGIDNSGKTTVVNKLIQNFPNNFVSISEPCKGKCLVGKFLRNTVLSRKMSNILCEESKIFLFSACRIQHLSELKNINSDKIFLFDRSFLSLYVYNNLNQNLMKIVNINKDYFEDIFDILIVFILKISPETSLQRSPDIYKYNELKKIYNRYENLKNIKNFKFNIQKINAEADRDEVYIKIKSYIDIWIR